jgi:SAM-dependent methyltransferase
MSAFKKYFPYLRNYLIDKWCLHFEAYDWYRHRLLKRFMIKGPIKVLNVGTGSGYETLKLLEFGNYVEGIEINNENALRALARIENHGFSKRYKGFTGHLLSFETNDKYDEVYMCEVLEHIVDDVAALQRISNWLVPGGRLILSTPTASYGQSGSKELSIKEDGGHVRVGYDGPELDQILEKVDLFTLRRIFIGNPIIIQMRNIERVFKGRQNLIIKLFSYGVSFFMRPLILILDVFSYRPYNQITIAIKKYW